MVSLREDDPETCLWVAVRTQIAQPPADTRVLLGHTATLQCRVTGDSSVAYRLSWWRGQE